MFYLNLFNALVFLHKAISELTGMKLSCIKATSKFRGYLDTLEIHYFGKQMKSQNYNH